MTRTTTISLGDHFADYVEQGVESGRYASNSDMVRAALRLLEERDERQRALLVRLSDAPLDDEPLIEEDRFRLGGSEGGGEGEGPRLSSEQLVRELCE